MRMPSHVSTNKETKEILSEYVALQTKSSVRGRLGIYIIPKKDISKQGGTPRNEKTPESELSRAFVLVCKVEKAVTFLFTQTHQQKQAKTALGRSDFCTLRLGGLRSIWVERGKSYDISV